MESNVTLTKDGRRTKIVWSFESRVLDDARAQQVLAEDVDALRLVLNRATADQLPRFIDQLRSLYEKQRTESGVARALPSIMIDLQEGARASVTGLAAPKELAFEESVTIGETGSGATIEIHSRQWDGLFQDKAYVYGGYGNVVLRVKSVNGRKISADVVQGGTIYPDMDLHVPSTRRPPTLAEYKTPELDGLLKRGIDFLVLPSVESTADIVEFRKFIAKKTTDTNGTATPWLVLRVDSVVVYEKLDELLEVVDGVLISRKDLALSMNPAQIPMVTKEIIQRCNDHAKFVLTASEMLGSMRRNVTPTRAEVSDIANAVIDGTDAVVLSEEVAHGKYASQALQFMRRTIADIESSKTAEEPNWVKLAPTVTTEMDAVSFAAYRTARRVQAKAIVCITKAGNTALKLASFRAPVPIIAVTFSPDVLRKLSVVRGVDGLVLGVDPKIDDVLPVVNDRLLRDSWLQSGDRIVFISVTLSSLGREASNLFTVQQLA
jgi:pyruvate kinase